MGGRAVACAEELRIILSIEGDRGGLAQTAQPKKSNPVDQEDLVVADKTRIDKALWQRTQATHAKKIRILSFIQL